LTIQVWLYGPTPTLVVVVDVSVSAVFHVVVHVVFPLFVLHEVERLLVLGVPFDVEVDVLSPL
jgi:hypothetical protein